MSSSEPRLPFGEGLEEVCAPMPPPLEPGPSAPTPPPLAQPSAVAGSGPPVVAAEWAATTMSQLKGAGTLSSATPTGVLPRPKQDQDALPRLVTFSDLVFDAPPWLFSAMLHMIAVIVLGLTFIIPESTEALLLRFDYTENLGNEMIGEDLDVSLDVIDEPLDSAIEPLQITELVDTTLVEPTERPLPLMKHRRIGLPTTFVRLV